MKYIKLFETHVNENIFKNIFKSKSNREKLEKEIDYLESNTYFNTYRELMSYIDTIDDAVDILIKISENDEIENDEIYDYKRFLEDAFWKLVKAGKNTDIRGVERYQMQDIKSRLESIL